MILEYAPKGELYTLLKQVGSFNDEKAATVSYPRRLHNKDLIINFSKVYSPVDWRFELLSLKESDPSWYQTGESSTRHKRWAQDRWLWLVGARSVLSSQDSLRYSWLPSAGDDRRSTTRRESWPLVFGCFVLRASSRQATVRDSHSRRHLSKDYQRRVQMPNDHVTRCHRSHMSSTQKESSREALARGSGQSLLDQEKRTRQSQHIFHVLFEQLQLVGHVEL